MPATDADYKAFESLKTTGAGRCLRLSIKEGNIALHYIKKCAQAMDGRSRDSWRKRWIAVSENGSRAIERLALDHNWPPEAQHDPNFTWVPKGARRWVWRPG